MRSEPECLVCMLNQAWNTARIATEDRDQQREIIESAAQLIQDTDLGLTPADNSRPIYDLVARISSVDDPFKELKQRTNDEALNMLPELQKTVEQAEDRIATALHVTVAGNIIDLGIGHAYDLHRDIEVILRTPFRIDHTEMFKQELVPDRTLLMLGDNAGEIVFDRVLIEELLRREIQVTYSVKSYPIINDATMEDAETAGITQLVPVIETGAGDIGINFDNVSDEFLKAFESADLILAKGHGNYETCDTRLENIYFLLKAKCNVVAGGLGVERDAIVFKNNRYPATRP
ncbi:MAG: DUF89 family protein [Fidelibacterota bacterium]|nr:MAG: DUF89 family protein [Candidatus Neomarinimicrobiota bacterium]